MSDTIMHPTLRPVSKRPELAMGYGSHEPVEPAADVRRIGIGMMKALDDLVKRTQDTSSILTQTVDQLVEVEHRWMERTKQLEGDIATLKAQLDAEQAARRGLEDTISRASEALNGGHT